MAVTEKNGTAEVKKRGRRKKADAETVTVETTGAAVEKETTAAAKKTSRKKNDLPANVLPGAYDEEDFNALVCVPATYSLKECTGFISGLMRNVERSSFKIGVLLNIVQARYSTSFSKFNAQWAGGYENIYDYANREFGIARGTCNGFMNVCRKFTENTINPDDGLVHLLPEFEGFGMSQLLVMLPFEDSELRECLQLGVINNTMSVRTLKNELAGIKKLEASGSNVRTDEALEADESACEDAVIEASGNSGTGTAQGKASGVLFSYKSLQDFECARKAFEMKGRDYNYNKEIVLQIENMLANGYSITVTCTK